MVDVVQFLSNLFGNAGSFLVGAINSLKDFVSLCPTWFGYILLGIVSVLVIRLVLK